MEVAAQEAADSTQARRARATIEVPSQATQEGVDYKDRYLRTLADFENFRKRSEREKTDLMKEIHDWEEKTHTSLQRILELEKGLASSDETAKRKSEDLAREVERLQAGLGNRRGRGQIVLEFPATAVATSKRSPSPEPA